MASVLLLSSLTWWMWHSVIDDICSTIDLTGCLRQALLYNIHSVMLAFYQILCNDAWTHDYYRYDKKLIGLWTWRHHYEEFIKGRNMSCFLFYCNFICLTRGGFPQKWLQFLQLEIVGTSLELNHWYLGLPRHQRGCEEHNDLQKKLPINFRFAHNLQQFCFLHFPFFVRNAPPWSKLGARTRTEPVSCLMKRGIMNKILYYTKTTKLKHEPVNTTPLGMKLKVIQLEVNTELCRKKWVYFQLSQNWSWRFGCLSPE